MHSLRLAGILFAVLAIVCLLAGTGNFYMGSEAADNVCDDPGIDPCRGRDARAQGFRETGQFLLWGGFLVVLLSGLMFILAGRKSA